MLLSTFRVRNPRVGRLCTYWLTRAFVVMPMWDDGVATLSTVPVRRRGLSWSDLGTETLSKQVQGVSTAKLAFRRRTALEKLRSAAFYGI